jgi:hypothetical protein
MLRIDSPSRAIRVRRPPATVLPLEDRRDARPQHACHARDPLLVDESLIVREANRGIFVEEELEHGVLSLSHRVVDPFIRYRMDDRLSAIVAQSMRRMADLVPQLVFADVDPTIVLRDSIRERALAASRGSGQQNDHRRVPAP